MTETLAVAIVAIAALVGQAGLHHRERKDLLNRIMLPNYGDYQASQQPQTGGSASNPLRQALIRVHDPAVTAGGMEDEQRR